LPTIFAFARRSGIVTHSAALLYDSVDCVRFAPIALCSAVLPEEGTTRQWE
jgi:hypothetical protein